jgi:hypothetical protein
MKARRDLAVRGPVQNQLRADPRSWRRARAPRPWLSTGSRACVRRVGTRGGQGADPRRRDRLVAVQNETQGFSRPVWLEYLDHMSLGQATRALNIAGAICLAVWVFANTSLWYHYAQTRPRVRNPTAGHIYPLNTHGSIVYLTLTDYVILHGTLTAAIIGAFCVMGLTLRRNNKGR